MYPKDAGRGDSLIEGGALGGSGLRWLLGLALGVFTATAAAQEARPKPSDVSAAIDRGLAFLARDALAWKKQHNCVSCHHAGLVIWSMFEARKRGHAVDEPVLEELTKWVAESGDGKTGVPRPAGIPKALNVKAVNFALALEANPAPDAASQKGLKLLLETIKGDQTEDGAWASWPETRPPIFGNSDDSMTALATLALLPAAGAGDDSAKVVRDKGVAWLAANRT